MFRNSILHSLQMQQVPSCRLCASMRGKTFWHFEHSLLAFTAMLTSGWVEQICRERLLNCIGSSALEQCSHWHRTSTFSRSALFGGGFGGPCKACMCSFTLPAVAGIAIRQTPWSVFQPHNKVSRLTPGSGDRRVLFRGGVPSSLGTGNGLRKDMSTSRDMKQRLKN